jgi:Icc-related predicted phosphoesterase
MMLFPSILALLATSSSRPPKAKPHVKMDHHMLQSVAQQSNALVWIDVENARGKSGFELSHMDVINKVTLWAQVHDLVGKVTLVVDHGTVKSGYWLEDRGLAVVFAGPSQKADDVIAHDVGLFGNAVVVTADGELQRRCKRSAQQTLHIMRPEKFLNDLESTSLQFGQHELVEESADGDTTNEEVQVDDEEVMAAFEDIELGKMDTEIKLGGQLLEAESMLRTKKGITNKRKKKLEKRVQTIREKLSSRGPSVLNRVTSILGGRNPGDDMAREQQDALLSRWQQIRNVSPRREQTGDRVIMAERLRRWIVDSGEGSKTVGETTEQTPAKAHVQHMNGFLAPATIRAKNTKNVGITKNVGKTLSVVNGQGTFAIGPVKGVNKDVSATSTASILAEHSDKSLDTLTICVVSDTHGFEQQFSDLEGEHHILPEADLLLHCGDFAADGTYESCIAGLEKFDEWLAVQPHKYKIVLRGNHDPWHFDFPQSGAWYVTRPTSLNLGNFIIALVPYSSSRLLAASGGIPSQCDIMASHVPPHKDLDLCLNGRHAGSGFLNRVVYAMVGEKPRVWFCGHIHEGRGIKRKRFGKGKGRETTVINASNANPGMATHLRHGPVVVKLDARKDDVEILEMEDKSIDKLESQAAFFDQSVGQEVNEMLLAVDLGLRSGVSLFNNRGELVRYEQFHFERETLQETAQQLVQEWEEDVNKDMDSSDPRPWRVTHLAIEGGDPAFRDAWSEATEDVSLLYVSPEEWRGGLLLDKEKTSGKDSKAAARLIARQVVTDFGVMSLHDGKFKTDVAEAVVLGLYVARKLGWITREPAIRRYTNGQVVVPKAFGKVMAR